MYKMWVMVVKPFEQQITGDREVCVSLLPLFGVERCCQLCDRYDGKCSRFGSNNFYSCNDEVGVTGVIFRRT